MCGGEFYSRVQIVLVTFGLSDSSSVHIYSLLLVVRFRHQYIWWDGVEGSADGEDREDLSWGSCLHLRSAQGDQTRSVSCRLK